VNVIFRLPALPRPRLSGRGGVDPREALLGAFATLVANPIRAALTSLGILIGVAAVIATVAVGDGARQQVQDQIRSLGAELLLIWPGSITQGGARLGAGQRQNLTWDDAQLIPRELPRFRTAVAMIRGPQQVVGGNQNWATQLTGTDPGYFEALDWPIAAGRVFTPAEAEASRKVVVLGATVAETLFGGEDPVGREIRIRATPFEVIGVLGRKGQGGYGQDLDDAVFAPFWTVRRSVMGASLANARTAHWIVARVETGEDMRAAEEELRSLFRQRHRIPATESDSVNIRNMADVAASEDASSRTLSALLAAVAAVSLLVGGIGVMNIMLVGVTERTREIGLRLAVGARRRDILAQFLAEALVLTLLGGLAGVVLGISLSYTLAAWAGWPVLVRPEAIALAIGVSGLTGVFFGFWPARRAARLDPIMALRHD
jgi:putative ABC transport system permease protein